MRTFVKYYWSDEIKKDRMGEVYDANWEEEKIIDDLIADLRVRDIFVVLGLDSSIILKLILKKESEMSLSGSVGLRRGKSEGFL